MGREGPPYFFWHQQTPRAPVVFLYTWTVKLGKKKVQPCATQTLYGWPYFTNLDQSGPTWISQVGQFVWNMTLGVVDLMTLKTHLGQSSVARNAKKIGRCSMNPKMLAIQRATARLVSRRWLTSPKLTDKKRGNRMKARRQRSFEVRMI